MDVTRSASDYLGTETKASVRPVLVSILSMLLSFVLSWRIFQIHLCPGIWSSWLSQAYVRSLWSIPDLITVISLVFSTLISMPLVAWSFYGIFQLSEVKLESCVFWLADSFQTKVEGHQQENVVTVHSWLEALPHWNVIDLVVVGDCAQNTTSIQ